MDQQSAFLPIKSMGLTNHTRSTHQFTQQYVPDIFTPPPPCIHRKNPPKNSRDCKHTMKIGWGGGGGWIYYHAPYRAQISSKQQSFTDLELLVAADTAVVPGLYCVPEDAFKGWAIRLSSDQSTACTKECWSTRQALFNMFMYFFPITKFLFAIICNVIVLCEMVDENKNNNNTFSRYHLRVCCHQEFKIGEGLLY